jgi:hypothetical protein
MALAPEQENIIDAHEDELHTTIPENDVNNSVEIYPNPVNTQMIVKANDFGKAEIFNSLGSKIMDANSAIIDVSSLTPGIYFINVHTRNGKIEKFKFVKE